jgi:hypothetical protein
VEAVAGEASGHGDVAAWFELWRRDPSDEEPRRAGARETSLREALPLGRGRRLLLARVNRASRRAGRAGRDIAQWRASTPTSSRPRPRLCGAQAAFRRDPSDEDVRRRSSAAGRAGLWGGSRPTTRADRGGGLG